MTLAADRQPVDLTWHARDVKWSRYARWVGIFCAGWMAANINFGTANMAKLWDNTHKLVTIEKTVLPACRARQAARTP